MNHTVAFRSFVLALFLFGFSACSRNGGSASMHKQAFESELNSIMSFPSALELTNTRFATWDHDPAMERAKNRIYVAEMTSNAMTISNLVGDLLRNNVYLVDYENSPNAAIKKHAEWWDLEKFSRVKTFKIVKEGTNGATVLTGYIPISEAAPRLFVHLRLIEHR